MKFIKDRRRKMAKKKQIKKLAEASIKILRSGKIKVAKGQKISLKPFVRDSVEKSIVSRLDGIISKEDVIIDTSNLRCDVTSNLTDEFRTADLAARVQTPKTQTIVISMTKKQILNAFDFLDGETLGILLRTSTLGSIYSELKESWVELNDGDKTQFTNVLFIPKIMVFIDAVTGKIRKQPMYVNLLVVATPDQNKMVENGVVKVTDEMASARVIADIVEAGIKCGVKDVIINPYGNKIVAKDLALSANLWQRIVTGQHFMEQYDSYIFALEKEDQYITFNAAKVPVTI